MQRHVTPSAWVLTGLLLGACAATPVDADKQAVARQMLNDYGWSEFVTKQFRALPDQLAKQIADGSDQRLAAAKQLVDTQIVPAMLEHVGELLDPMAAVYAKYLTVEEMREMDAQARSPLGQKQIWLINQLGLSRSISANLFHLVAFPPGSFTPEEIRQMYEMDRTPLADRQRGIVTRVTEEISQVIDSWADRVLQGISLPPDLDERIVT